MCRGGGAEVGTKGKTAKDVRKRQALQRNEKEMRGQKGMRKKRSGTKA